MKRLGASVFGVLLALLFAAAVIAATTYDANTAWDAQIEFPNNTSCGFPGSPCTFDSVQLSSKQPRVAYSWQGTAAAADYENFELHIVDCASVRVRSVVTAGDDIRIHACPSTDYFATPSCNTAAGETLLTITTSTETGPYKTWPSYVVIERNAIAGAGKVVFACMLNDV